MTTQTLVAHSDPAIELSLSRLNHAIKTVERSIENHDKASKRWYAALDAIKEFEQGDMSDTEALAAIREMARAAL